ncbi:ATP-dependent DNA helicase PIF1-like [Gordionus sp. m RMFG-2023]|uniref:ATP-dependent DNA helicase PIF1-like n=1 Tax=Gordionus sp. m RMFG-2023 TaxID=3053472 RepID=UPI0031FBC256
MALMDIENVFLDHGLCCQSFDLPSPTKIPPKQHYDAHVEAADSIKPIELENIPERYFFVDGPGGSGKTYLYNTLMCYIRAKNQIASPFATTGISSILLKGGKTIHSGFKLPVPIFETSTSHMNLHSSLALDIKNSKLIIIDEATMMTKHALRCIDRLLKDIMKNSHPFGGKVILLGGDLRQTLPVVPKSSKVDIIESCIKKIADIDSLSTKIILTTKNKIALTLNNDIINIISGPIKHYYSADSIESDNKDDIMNFPLEFLHTQTPSGMPPHKLTLKVGTIVMLLRNLSPKKGLCNGTRLIIRHLHINFIDAEVLTGTNKGYRDFLPRIDLAPSDSQLPFTLKRRQFPIIPAFVITINKSQGQTFDHVGLFLPEPVFAYGQLYVALNRNLKIL